MHPSPAAVGVRSTRVICQPAMLVSARIARPDRRALMWMGMPSEKRARERADRDRERSEEAHWRVAEAGATQESRLLDAAAEFEAQEVAWENEGGSLDQGSDQDDAARHADSETEAGATSQMYAQRGSMQARSVRIAVSLARVPLREISQKVEELEALGWREDRRGDPWAASFVKDFPEGEESAAEAEVRRVMGNYWVDATAARALLGK